jgi:hypothetical protein
MSRPLIEPGSRASSAHSSIRQIGVVHVGGELPGDPVAGRGRHLEPGVPAGAGEHGGEAAGDAEEPGELGHGQHLEAERAGRAEPLIAARVHDGRRSRAVAQRSAEAVEDDLGERALVVEAADAEVGGRAAAVMGEGGTGTDITVGLDADAGNAVVGV